MRKGLHRFQWDTDIIQGCPMRKCYVVISRQLFRPNRPRRMGSEVECGNVNVGGRFLHYWGMEKFVFAIRTDGTVLQMSAGKILTPSISMGLLSITFFSWTLSYLVIDRVNG